MRITIFGAGYVGLVTGACMAETGNHVACVDFDQDKIDRLNAGEVPNCNRDRPGAGANGRRIKRSNQ